MKDLFLLVPAFVIMYLIYYAFKQYHEEHHDYVDFLKQNNNEKQENKIRDSVGTKDIHPRETQHKAQQIATKRKEKG